MKLNFLVGSLILRKHKTGVHLYHENLIKQFIKKSGYKINISVYESYHSLNSRYKGDIPFEKYLKYSFKLARILAYILPIELFFGRSNIYMCDGMIPITVFNGYKIAIIHDLMVFRYPENYTFIKKIYLKFYFWQVKHRADFIIAVSKTTKTDIIKYLGVKENKIGIVYNGINKPIKNINIEKIKGYSLNVKYFLSIGECRPNKNFLIAIKAFAKYREQCSDKIFFYLAGNNNNKYGEFLKRYVEENSLSNSVIFLGYVTEVEKIALYQHANIFIFVSEYEGFGVPIIEAMSYGTPVITSKVSSMLEIAKDAAILVEPNNENEIKEALCNLENNNLWNYYRKYGRERCKQFSWENAYIQFNSILKRLI